ncbi:MAG: SprB repeat-containing protein, partial [Bacteroidota bacterium]
TWSGPNGFTANTLDINGLEAGTYVLDITDTESCEIVDFMVVVEEPDALIIDCASTTSDFGANNGTLTVTVAGGTPPYTLDYNGTIVNNYQSGTAITNLPPATYNIMITDANGCSESCTEIITEINCDLAIINPSVQNPACPGENTGSITIELENAVGTPSITWSVPGFDNLTTITGLSAGTYTVTVGDDNCTLSPQSFTLNDPAQLAVDIAVTGSIQCHGDSTVSLLANITNGVAPFSYNWEMTTYPDTNELNDVPAGEYILEVTDDAGCTARDTVNVSEPEDLILSCTPTGESSSGANDGSIAIGFTGAGLLSLSGDLTAANITNADSPLTFNNLAPGNYTLTLTDENGCTETCMAFVNPGGCDMTVDLLVTQPNCSSPDTGRITAIVTGGTAPYSYAWTGNTTSTTNFADDVTAGNYILIVTDDLGCTAIADTTINQFMDFPFLVVSPSEMICPDDCAPFDLSPLGIAPFSVSYRIIEDLSGVPLGQSNLTIVNPGDTSIVVCPGDFGLPSLADHTVEFFIIGDQICDAEFSITRSTLIRPLATDTVRTTHCAGDVVTIAGQDFMSGNERGEITLPDASVHGCDSLVVVDLTFLDAVTSTVDTMVCLGGSVTLEGNVFDAVTPTGSFTSATPSSIGCDSVVTVSLGFFPELIGNLDSTVCRGGSISIGGQVF